MRPHLLLLPLVLSSLSLHAAESQDRLVRGTEPLTADQERAALHVPPGFELQLFASEPMINKPINMAFDARGRLWVSSTVEYPYSADKSRWSDPQGTRVKDSRDAIKILEDTDGDGQADKVIDFADGLNIPTGVVPWHKPEHTAGCIAWSIPNIWYFADTDGDDKADVRQILFGPLGYEKDTHGMCSSFRLGLDGWVYATHGFNNTSTFKAKDGSTLELHSGNVFRFKPDGSTVERWTHGQVNPFGLCWDRYGNLYSADCHSSPIYQLIRGAHYPSFGKPHDGLGFAPVMCEHTHGSTGICGIVYLDGGVWGPDWDDHMLVGNPVTSKVNHDLVTFTGSTPKANERPDFITSDDPWFRPVDLQLGPDNALYIADFYNRIIGHYEVPLDHPGRDKERGRIWRVSKKGTAKPAKDLVAMPVEELVKELASPNLTRRKLASEVFVMRNQAPSLSEVPWSASHALWIHGRLGQLTDMQFRQTMRLGDFAAGHAMRAQAAFRDLPGVPGYRALTSLFVDAGPNVIGGGVSVIPFMGDERDAKEGAKAQTEAQGLSRDPSLIVPLATSLQRKRTDDPLMTHVSKVALRELLRGAKAFKYLPPDYADIAEIALAVPTAAASAWLWRALQLGDDKLPSSSLILAHIARHGDPALVPQVIALAKEHQLADAPSPVTLVTALSDGLSERGSPMSPELLSWAQELADAMLADLARKPQPSWMVPASANSPAWALKPRKCADGKEVQVLQSMSAGGGDEESRTGILRSKDFAAPNQLSVWINGHRGFPKGEAHDKNLVRVVDAASGTVLATVFPPRNDVCQRLEMDLAKHAGKQVRLEIVDGDDGKAYAWLGITRIEPAVVSVDDFQTEDTLREGLKKLAVILQHSAPAALREKLAAYLPPRPAPPPLPISPEQRKQIDALIASRVASFAKASPDVSKGKQVFQTNCAVCHRIGGEGGLIGPQLDGIGTRGVARLSEDILDPNRNVDAHFHVHTFTLKDGTVFSGFLKAEAGQVNILVDAAGKEHRVTKKDVEKSDVMPMSLMPPVFGQTIDEVSFHQLLGYLLGK